MQHHSEQSKIVKDWLDAHETHEAPWGYRRWAALLLASVAGNRQVYINFMGKPLYPNLYVIFSGDVASRKSTVIDNVLAILDEAEYTATAPSALTRTRVAAMLSSKSHIAENNNRIAMKKDRAKTEALSVQTDNMPDLGGDVSIADMAAKLATSIADKPKVSIDIDTALTQQFEDNVATYGTPLAVVMNELANAFTSEAAQCWQLMAELWDCPDAFPLDKNSIYKPYCTMLGAVNPESLTHIFPRNALNGALMSRVIFVNPEPSSRICDPFGIDNSSTDKDMVALFKTIRDMRGEMTMSKEARAFYMRLHSFPDWSWTVPDTRFSQYVARRTLHTVKLAMCQALLCERMTIEECDIQYAHTLLSYAEFRMPMAIGQYGWNRNAASKQAILQELSKSPKGLTADEINKRVATVMTSESELTGILLNLTREGHIEQVEDAIGKEGKVERYFLNKQPPKEWSAQIGQTVFPDMLQEWGDTL